MREPINRAGGVNVAQFRKNNQMQANAKIEVYSLRAWCWQIPARAKEDGPMLAAEMLANLGIPLVVERYLPKTYLDGAALRFRDGRPAIGLNLRYDRIDGFRFSLLHELAYVCRYMDTDGGEGCRRH